MKAESPPSPPVGVNVLLVEDDADVAVVVRDGLESGLFAIDHVGTIALAKERLSSRVFDAVILDLSLPDGDGLDLASSIRAERDDTPILILSGRGTVEQRIDGFHHGADDYLCKPFSIDELKVRMDALLRRTLPERKHILKYADLELDLLERAVRRGDRRVTLSAREVDLLSYLIRRADQVLERARILRDVWGDDAEEESNVLSVYVNFLRNKLEDGRFPRLIHTVRGVGFIFTDRPPDGH